MFFYVYLLRSERTGGFYIGYTNDLKKRIEKHNSREVYWTKRATPWKLIYCESYISREDALNREKQLKRHAKGFAQLRRRLLNTIRMKGEG